MGHTTGPARPPKRCEYPHTTLHRRPSPSWQPPCRERSPRPSGSQCPARVAPSGGRPSDPVGGERHPPGTWRPARHRRPPRGAGIPPRRGRVKRPTGGAGNGDASPHRRPAPSRGAVTREKTTPPRGRRRAGGRLAADRACIAGMGASPRRRNRATAAVDGGAAASPTDGRPRARVDAVRPIDAAHARGSRHRGVARAHTCCGSGSRRRHRRRRRQWYFIAAAATANVGRRGAHAAAARHLPPLAAATAAAKSPEDHRPRRERLRPRAPQRQTLAAGSQNGRKLPHERCGGGCPQQGKPILNRRGQPVEVGWTIWAPHRSRPAHPVVGRVVDTVGVAMHATPSACAGVGGDDDVRAAEAASDNCESHWGAAHPAADEMARIGSDRRQMPSWSHRPQRPPAEGRAGRREGAGGAQTTMRQAYRVNSSTCVVGTLQRRNVCAG